MGAEPSKSNEAGVFNSSSAAESTPAGHGKGTAYCGRIVGRRRVEPIYYTISTGIGTYSRINAFGEVQPDCLAATVDVHDEAHCDYSLSTNSCPLGWGNRRSYLNFKPGCFAGTYYPNPTPASNTDISTGSRKCKNHNYSR